MIRPQAERRWTVVQLVPAMNTGGAERSTLEIGQALVAAGHRSIVISAGGSWVPTLLAQGSEHIVFSTGEKSLSSVMRLPALRRLLKAIKPDLIHARSRLPAWMARIVRRTLWPKPAFVTTVHGLNSVNRYSEVMTRGDRVIVVSETTLRHVCRHYPAVDRTRLRLIPRGVDAEQFPAAAHEFADAAERTDELRRLDREQDRLGIGAVGKLAQRLGVFLRDEVIDCHAA